MLGLKLFHVNKRGPWYVVPTARIWTAQLLWRGLHHWSKWQLSVQPVTKISSKLRYFCFSDWLYSMLLHITGKSKSSFLFPLLLTPFSFNPNMDKYSIIKCGWNSLSIPKLQWCNRWSLGTDKQFHPTLLGVWLFIHAGFKVNPC